jgi:spectinomycin phosphotransferase
VYGPPAELTDADVLSVVRERWDGDVTRVEHLAVGFGAHHWRAIGSDGCSLFVTYDRYGSRHTAEKLVAAYQGAVALAVGRLEFVIAPRLTRSGDVLVPLDAGALSCTPWIDGSVVGEGALEDAETAAANIADLGRLHGVTPPRGLPRWSPLVGAGFPTVIAQTVADRWATGPYGEPARLALADRLDQISAWTDRYLRLARLAGDRPWVATHGETHTRNQLRTADGIRFVDWESLKLAPRERDLSTLVQAGYADDVGADPAMVELFDLEWRLSEIDVYARWFAGPHTDTADDRIAYGGLLAELDRGPWWDSR